MMTARLWAALCLMGLLLLTGCGKSPPLEYLGEDAVILAYGDSLTHGTGAPDGQSYPEQLAQLIDRRVVAAGVPGEVSREGLARLPGVLDQTRPDLLLLCHGGNDILRDLDKTALRENLTTMIELARERGIAVVLIAVPKRALILRPAEVYAELADAYDIPLVKDAVGDVLGESRLRADRVHPNAAGYRRIAEAVKATLVDAGAVAP